MNLRIKTLIYTLAVCPLISANSQNIPISALPVSHNGGFAGEAGAPRINTFHVVSSGKYSRSLNSYLSYDNFFKKLRSGIAVTGGLMGYDQGRSATYSSIAISPKFSASGKYTFSPFVDVSFYHANLKYPYFYVQGQAQPAQTTFPYNHYSSKVGFLFNSSKAYAGITAEFYERAHTAIPGAKYKRFFTSMRYEVQAGYTYQPTPESDWSFTPQIAVAYKRYNIPDSLSRPYSVAHALSLVDFSLIVRYKKFITGINNNGLVLGYQTDRFKIQIANLYVGQGGGFFESTHINNVHLYPSPFYSMKTYTGSLAVRYVFKKPTGPKMNAF